MNKTLIVIALSLCSLSVGATTVEAPPQMGSYESTPVAPVNIKKAFPVTQDESSKLTEEEIRQAKKTVEEARANIRKTESRWSRTKMEETINNRGQVTEITITPRSTQIPYTMTRETMGSPQSSDSAAGKGNTMSVPKFIQFGF